MNRGTYLAAADSLRAAAAPLAHPEGAAPTLAAGPDRLSLAYELMADQPELTLAAACAQAAELQGALADYAADWELARCAAWTDLATYAAQWDADADAARRARP